MRITDFNNKYTKKGPTPQDMISSDIKILEKKLEGFVQIHEDNYEDLDTGIWIKYISNEGKYRSGGVLLNNKYPKYIVLKNPFTNISWCADLSTNIFFMKQSSLLNTIMIEKNNLYKLYEAGLVKILDKPQ